MAPVPTDPPLDRGNSHLQPSLPFGNRIARVAWWWVHLLLVRWTRRPLHGWRATVYRLCGARLGPDCHIYPSARVWAPWNLVCEDTVGIGEGAVVYNPATITLGSHCVISQDAYLCGATHDFELAGFPMQSRPIRVGRHAWICARAVVGPGVVVGEGAVLGTRGSIVRGQHFSLAAGRAGFSARGVSTQLHAELIPVGLTPRTEKTGDTTENAQSRA